MLLGFVGSNEASERKSNARLIEPCRQIRRQRLHQHFLVAIEKTNVVSALELYQWV